MNKIIDTNRHKSVVFSVLFGELKPGDAFKYNNWLFIKTLPVPYRAHSTINALYLREGDIHCFPDDCEVIPVNFVIEVIYK